MNALYTQTYIQTRTLTSTSFTAQTLMPETITSTPSQSVTELLVNHQPKLLFYSKLSLTFSYY